VSDDVDQFKAGDTVFGVVMGTALGPGTFAEYVNTPAANAACLPDGFDLPTAGAIGLAGATAWDSVEAVTLASGDSVLISGATGGVGAFAVQLAAARGARVIATAGPGEEEAFVRDLGASDVVDHHGDLAESIRALCPDGLDAVVHLAGDGPALAALCKSGGRLSSTIGLTNEEAGRSDVHVTAISAMPTTATLERLAAAVQDGDLRVPIQRSYALAEVPQALTDFAGKKLGKLAVRVPE
jgi:NADPH:quinone reductase-like Zn-dependent oxidoreductase